MKAKIIYQCKPAENPDGPPSEIFMTVDLPFTPSQGTMLRLTNGGPFIPISDVMIDIAPDGEGVLVFLEEPNESRGQFLRDWHEMKAQGWQLG